MLRRAAISRELENGAVIGATAAARGWFAGIFCAAMACAEGSLVMTDEVLIMVVSSDDAAKIVAGEWVEAAGCGGGSAAWT
jgi:hypothetical protein